MPGKNQVRHGRPRSRREFAALAAAAPVAFPPRSADAAGLSAADVIDRIKQSLAVEWKADSVDGSKAGDPATAVTGIVTTSLPTMAVLRQTAKAGANLVVATQPVFYSRKETPDDAADPILAAKQAFIAKHRLVVFRLRDHWRLRQPDPLAQGLGNALGWAKYQLADDASRYDIPPVTLASLVSHAKKRLNARGGFRVIGDPRTTVRKIALLPGSTPLNAALQTLPHVDVIVAGEVREWESVEYARDAVDSGQRKALVLVGRIVSEEPGMGACANWLKTLVPEVPVRHLPAGDPYWRPA
jgi:putative NIF3 family GTP cyclohydrolase 1 type 2